MHPGDTRIRQFQHEPFCLLTQLALLPTNTTQFTSTSPAKEPLYLHTEKHATSNKQIVYNQSPASFDILHLSTILTITSSKRTFRSQKACSLLTISRTNSGQQKAWHLIKTTHNGPNEWPPIRISELKTMQPNAIQFTTTSHNGNKPRNPVRKSRQKIL
jgi:hypothetical protein